MVEFIIELLVDILLMFIFSYPGAFIRWAFTGFKKPFDEVLNDNRSWNGFLGLLILGLLIVSLKYFFS
jgi:uncharacterized protein involved in cysteine biosynthesis